MQHTNNHIVSQFNVCRCCVAQKMPFEYIYCIDCAQKHRECKHTKKIKQKNSKFVHKIDNHIAR